MSDAIGLEMALRSRRGPGLPAFARAVLLGGAWFPFFALVVVYVPRFAPIFARLEQHQELPTLSLWLLGLWRLSAATFGLPILVFATVLVLSDLGFVRATGHLERGIVLYWTWFVAVVLLALFACLLCVVAVLLPVYRMSSIM